MIKDLRQRLEKERDEICEWREQNSYFNKKVEEQGQGHEHLMILTLGEIEGMLDLLDAVDDFLANTKGMDRLRQAREKLGGGE
jgi:hypothetical protein